MPQTFSTYIFTIARNLAYNHMRDVVRWTKKEQLWEEISCQVSDETETHLLQREFQSAIDHIIKKLPPKKRTIYMLSQNEGKSNKEIVWKLKISPKTVKNHLWGY
nr:sigma-70 family RNA polymerase sigma factor [Sinomicrobium kalidii]